MTEDDATADNGQPHAVGDPVERPVRPLLERLRDVESDGMTFAGEAADEIERLRSLLARCRPIIDADAQMMADISRHAPLDADSQAKHDATEYESEKLARELERLLGPNAELTGPRRAAGP